MTHVDFERWAQYYDTSALQPVFRAAHDAVLDRARLLATHPRRILDLGCGTGRLLRAAAMLFPAAELFGVDASGRMLTMAKATGRMPPRSALVRAAAERLPFVDGSFDLVVSTASFRH